MNRKINIFMNKPFKLFKMKNIYRILTISVLFIISCSSGGDDSSDLNDSGDNNQTGQSADLFFSEYAEGSSFNKYIEIYNPNPNSVDLSNYQIKGTNNGTTWGDNGERELSLTGTLAANSVYVICADAADQAILDKANLPLAYESPVHFNGNDAIGIFGKDSSGEFSVIIDVIGNLTDPGTGKGWSVAGTENATVDHTLVRKNSINQSNSDWNSSSGSSVSNSEWEVKNKGDWTSLGNR